MTKVDRYIGISLVIIAIYMIYFAFTADYNQFGNDPGPTLLPMVVGIGLIFCGLFLILGPKSKKGDNSTKDSDNETKQYKNKHLIKTVVMFITLIIYVLLLEYIGFIYSTLISLSFTIWYLGEKRNIRLIVFSIIMSIIVTFSIFFIFEKYLKIFLP